MMRHRRRLLRAAGLWLFPGLCALVVLQAAPAQQAAPPSVVRPIDPQGIALPPEAGSAGVSKFSFIAYGDTRGPADGSIVQPQHAALVDRILEAIPEEREAGFPVRFIVQTGDAVMDGRVAAQWNVSFVPIVERLIRHARVPFLFTVGNHDVDYRNLGTRTVGDPDRELGLGNTSMAMSRLWPPQGSPRRLDGYPTFAFGYGRYFFIALDSTIAADDIQRNWVAHQLEALDRRRYPHVIAVFHHPVLTSTTGMHGGPRIEPQVEAMRRRYLPLFRRHHVRMTIAGHEHLYDHFVERYDDAGNTHRMDHIVSGGGGAPIYTYRGEPDLTAYANSAAPQTIRVEHLVRPGSAQADNPHHFVVVEVDGNRLWIRVVATVASPFRPYGQPRIELMDP